MNLDELQIKISIELDDLNKQLKTVTKGIDKALGPKATKKLMADNNKIIKSGLTSINKTTLNLVKKSRKDTTKEIEAMSKDINKSLTKAFDIDLTKFNSNITSAMNQARQTVRSACNDIRRELNAALNINGNIRVTSKTSISGSATGSSGSNAASSISSGQYIGAMIIKATNAMLKNNNSNTSKLESKIDNSTNKIVSAIKNIKSVSIGGNKAGISNGSVSGNRTSVNNGSVGGRAENTRGKTPSVIEVPYEIIIDEEPLEQVEDRIKLLGEGFRALAIETGKVNFILGKTGDIFEGTVQRMREAFNMVKSLGTSGINFDLGDTKEQILSVVELMKQIHSLRKGLVSDTTSFTYGEVITPQIVDLPMEQFKKVKEVIEDATYRVLEFEKALMNTSNFDLGGLKDQLLDVVELMKKIHNLNFRKGIPSDTTSFTLGEEGSQSLRGKVVDKPKYNFTEGIDVKEIIEGTFRDISDEVEQFADEVKKATTVINKATAMPGSKNNPIIEQPKTQAPSYVYTDKELSNNVFQGAINDSVDAVEQVQATMQKIRNIMANAENQDLIKEIEDSVDFMLLLIDPIEEGLSQVAKAIVEQLLGLVDSPLFDDFQKKMKQFQAQLNGESLPSNVKKTSSNNNAKHNLNDLKKLTSDLSKITPDLNAENGMKDYHRKQMNTILDANAKEVGAFTSKTDLSKLKDMMAQLQKMSEELESDLTELFHNVDPKYLEESLSSVRDVLKNFMPQLKEVVETLNKLDAERTKLNIDTTDAQRQIEALKASYEMLIEQCKAAYKANNANILRDIIPQIGGPVDSGNKRQYPAKPNLKRGDSDKPSKPGKPSKPTIMGFGFGAYKNEIDALIEYAKKAGEKIKKALFGKSGNGSNELAMTIDSDGGFSQSFDVLNGSIDKLITAIEDLSKNIELLTRQMKQSMNISSLFGGKGKNPIEKAISSIGKEIRKTTKGIKKDIRNALVKSFLSKKFGKNNDASLLKSLFGKKSKKEEKNSPIKSMLKAAFPNSYDLVKNLFPKLRETTKKAFADAGFDDALKEALGSIDFGEVAEKIKAVWKEDISDEDIPMEMSDEDVQKFQEKELNRRFGTQDDSDLTELDAVNDRLGSALKKLTSNLKEATEDIEQQQENIKKSVNKVGQVFPGALKSHDKSDNGDDELAMTIDTSSANKLVEKAKKIGERIKKALYNSDSQVLGFAPYQNELHELGQLAKRVGARIKKALSSAFTSIKTGRLHTNVSNALNKTKSAVSRFSGKVKSTLNKTFTSIKTGRLNVNVSNALGKAKNTVSKFSSKVRTTLNKAFTGIKSDKLYTSVSSGLNKARGAVSKFSSKARPALNKAFDGVKSGKLYTSVASGLSKAKGAISKFASSARPALSKVFDGIKLGGKVASGIKAGLSKAKGALQKFANGCKTLWGKIKQIFSKGANDAVKATGKLKSGLKGLLGQILSFGSIYGLINLGRQAIQQSTTLAQAEIKLTSLMKHRMGATNETVEAIRQLVKEQANLGVVSETALTKGVEQLSMYVHSAKALETLMPAIANLTAKRGGFFATPEDAEEVATQIGEAIREGTITPLEQSGIYLSEAEIKKFQALRTEEERAAFLAQVIANNVGNINEALAKTPLGAIAQLKNNFQSLMGTLGIFLANVLKPIVQWLNTIIVACNNALKALGNLLGFDMTGGALSVGDVGAGTGSTDIDTGGIDDTKDSLDETADSAEKAEEAVEKFKGSLMGFDEINVLSDNTNSSGSDPSEEFDPTDITPGEGGQLIPDVGELTEGEGPFDKFADKMKAFMDEILEPFKAAWDLLGDRWKAEWADLIDSFKHFCDSLGKFLKSVWEHGGKEFVQHMAEIGLACGIAAMEIGGEILDSLARLWDHLDPAKNMNTQGFLDALNEVSVKLRDFILGLGDHFESLMANGGQDVLNALGDCFMNLGEAAVRGIGVAIDALDGLIDHLDPANNENTKNMLKSLADMFHDIGQMALDLVSLLESCLVNGGQDMINAFGDMAMNIGQAASEVVSTVANTVSELSKHLDPANNDITRNMMKAWEEAFKSIGDMALSFSSFLKSTMENGGQDVVNAIGDTFNSILGLIGEIVDIAAKNLDGLWDHLDPAKNDYTKGFLKAWEEAFKGLSEMCTAFGDLLSSTFENGGQEITNSIGDVFMNLGELIGTVIDEFSQTLTELFEHMDPAKNENTKDMLDSFDKLFDSINGFVDACTKSFKTFMDNGGRDFFKHLGDILAILLDLSACLTGGLIDAVTSFLNSFAGQEMIKKCAELIEWLAEKLAGLKDVIDVIKDIFQDVIDIIVGILEGDGEKVGRAFASLIKNAFKLTGEILQWLVDIGVDLIKGLIKGICSLPGLLWDAIVFLFDTIVGFFKELFGIHSPSTVFADLGVNLIEGLIQGIENMISAISEIFTKIGETIFGWFEGILSSASENWGKLCEATSEKWGKIKETVSTKCKDIYEDAKEKWSNIKEAVSDKCKDIYEDTKEKWTNIKDKTVEIASNLKEKAVEKYTELKDKLTDAVDKWRQNSEEKWNKIKDKTNEITTNIKDTVQERYSKFKDTLTDTMEKWRSNSEEKWNKIKNKTSELVGNLKSTVEDKYNTMKENLTSKLESWRSTSESKWNDIKEKGLNAIENLRKAGEEKFESLKTSIISKMDTIKSDLISKWETVKSKTSEIVSNLKSDVETKYNDLKTNLGTKLEEVKSEASAKWESIKTTTSTKVREVVDEATKKYGEIKESFTKKMDEVKSALGPKWTELKNSVKTNAQGIGSKVSEGLSDVKKKFTKPFEDAKKAVGDVISSIGRTFKNANWSFPKIKLPHIKITGEWSFNPPRVPSFGIEWRKRGGIIDGITPLGFANGALQMGGEAGSELVMPLENTSFTSKIAMALGQAVDNALAKQSNPYNNNNNTNDNRDIVLKVNERELARTTINSINKLQMESGRTLLNI